MERTLLVLGAGASKDFCQIFPTGLELIKEINYHFLTEKKFPEVSESTGSYLSALMNEIVRVFGKEVELFREIKNRLWGYQLDYESKALRNKTDIPVSIDRFIANKISESNINTKAVEIIKYCIYYLIKGTEDACHEHYDFKKSWICKLAQKLTGYNFETISKNLTVVTFNYDRTFDKYFPYFLDQHKELSSDQISVLQNAVIHAYDFLGSLSDIPFELENDKTNVIKNHYKRLKLIGGRDQIELNLHNLDEFKKIHFIGFGYDDQNMKLINLGRFSSASFSGTAFHYTPTQIETLKVKYSIEARPISCCNYIDNLEI
jgi:hypothetical protein